MFGILRIIEDKSSFQRDNNFRYRKNSPFSQFKCIFVNWMSKNRCVWSISLQNEVVIKRHYRSTTIHLNCIHLSFSRPFWIININIILKKILIYWISVQNVAKRSHKSRNFRPKPSKMFKYKFCGHLKPVNSSSESTWNDSSLHCFQIIVIVAVVITVNFFLFIHESISLI